MTRSQLKSRSLRTILVLAVGLVSVAGISYFRDLRHRQLETSYRNQCITAQTSGEWAELQRLGELWSKLDSRSADALLFRADAAQHLDNFELAETLLDSISATDPKAIPAYVNLAKLQFGTLNKPLEGVKTCERILELDHRVMPAHEQLIEFYALTLQRRKLEYQIRFAIDHGRDTPQAYVYLFMMDTMRVAMGVEANSLWLQRHPDNELFLVARTLQMPEPDSGIKTQDGEDKYSQADALFKRFPNNLELLAYKVDLSLRTGNIEELMSLMMNLPPECDDDCRFWRAKGWLHLNRSEWAKAKESLHEAIALYPMDWNARNWLSNALRQEGNSTEANTLQALVQTARDLRTRISTGNPNQPVSKDALAELSKFASECGDFQVSKALNRRLGNIVQ